MTKGCTVKLVSFLITFGISVTSHADSFYYHFAEEGCSTKPQRFQDLAGICNGLKNEELNLSCAFELRKKRFQELKCPGDFLKSAKSTPGSEEVRCAGYVKGYGENIVIDKTFVWDGKSEASWVLLPFPENVQNNNHTGRITFSAGTTDEGISVGHLAAIFVDNNKAIVLLSEFKNSLSIFHFDPKIHLAPNKTVVADPRELRITCQRSHVKLEKKEPKQQTHFCAGVNLSDQSKGFLFFEPFDLNKSSNFAKTFAPDLKSNSLLFEAEYTYRAKTDTEIMDATLLLHKIEGGAVASATVAGNSELTFKYIEAWQDFSVETSCRNTHPKTNNN